MEITINVDKKAMASLFNISRFVVKHIPELKPMPSPSEMMREGDEVKVIVPQLNRAVSLELLSEKLIQHIVDNELYQDQRANILTIIEKMK